MKVAIIGAGLAGLSCYYFLKQYVSDIIVLDEGKEIAAQASGNSAGALNPRFTAFRTAESDFYTSGFSGAVTFFDQNKEAVAWKKCGALHLINDEKKKIRFEQTVQNWGWPEEYLRLVSKDEASQIAGVDLGYDAMYLSQSGYLNPKDLCAFYGDGAKIEFDTTIKSINDLDAEVIILACGQGIKDFKETEKLPIGHVRGQITQAKASEYSGRLQCNVHYGGYCTPAIDGVHMVGATFQRWLDHSEIIQKDDQDNIDKLGAVSEKLAEGLEICGHRASVRTTSHDHFPVIGRLPGYKNVYISAAHGSHGIVSSFAGARLIADMILGWPKSQSVETIKALSPDRFKV